MNVWMSEEIRVLQQFKNLEAYLMTEKATLAPVIDAIFFKGKSYLEYSVNNNIKVKSTQLKELELFCSNLKTNLEVQLAQAKIMLEEIEGLYQ